jgi:UDPglucose 6-dehydrogenase
MSRNTTIKFSVIGLGYVGLANSLVLAEYHKVVGFDQDQKVIVNLQSKNSHINEEGIKNALKSDKSDFLATDSKNLCYQNSDYVIIATPTNYDPEINFFDTSSVESSINDAIELSPHHALIIIKSTIPIGFVKEMNARHQTSRIVFCPEFLREGSSYEDAKNPSRIIIGSHHNDAKELGSLLKNASEQNQVAVIHTGSTEAEAIKLFSNTYLAMRVAFFNELDSFAMNHSLSSQEIIDGVSQDNRIGSFYNNPSFGFGGYCLPKDTKQLLANFNSTPQNIISAVVKSNLTRREFLAKKIIEMKPKKIGIYRVAMKANSDNYRSSAILKLGKHIKDNSNIEICIFEPEISVSDLPDFELKFDFDNFVSDVDLILANRIDENLEKVNIPIFTRDIYNEN